MYTQPQTDVRSTINQYGYLNCTRSTRPKDKTDTYDYYL